MNYYDTYNYGYKIDSNAAEVLAIYLIVLVVLFIFYVISYIFKGIGMYTMGKRLGMECPWLAFIPFARTYFHGELAGQIKLKTKSIRNPGIGLLAMPFVLAGITIVFYLIFILVGFASIVSSAIGGSTLVEPDVRSGTILGMLVVGGIWLVVNLIYKALYSVLMALVNYQIFAKFTSANMSIVHGVLCIVLPFYQAFSLFIFRNKKFNPGMEPDFGSAFCQPASPVIPVMPTIPETQSETGVKPEAEEKAVEQVPQSVVSPPAVERESLEGTAEEEKLQGKVPEGEQTEEKESQEPQEPQQPQERNSHKDESEL